MCALLAPVPKRCSTQKGKGEIANNTQLAFRVRAQSTHHVRTKSMRARASMRSRHRHPFRMYNSHLVHVQCVRDVSRSRSDSSGSIRHRKKCQYKLKSINLEVNLMLWALRMQRSESRPSFKVFTSIERTVRWVFVQPPQVYRRMTMYSTTNDLSKCNRFPVIRSSWPIRHKIASHSRLCRLTQTHSDPAAHSQRVIVVGVLLHATALRYVPVSSSFYHYLYN